MDAGGPPGSLGLTAPGKPLRLWPGVAAVAIQWLAKLVVPLVLPEAVPFAVMGGLALGVVIVVWWVFFSRAPWIERLGAVGLMILALFAASRLVDKSIAGGAMGMLLYVLAIPLLSLAFVASVVAGRRLSAGLRRATMAAAIVLACGVWTLVRTGGFSGDFQHDLQWRWTKTPEERLLALGGDEPAARPDAPAPAPVVAPAAGERPAAPAGGKAVALPPTPSAAEPGAEWPGFRGPGRAGVVSGVRIETNWSASPPVKLWRRPVGPGWSSFAVRAGLLYTQEQRGDDEIVACYKLASGEPVWRHRDKTRFWESNGGAGPRATPTIHNGRVYALGATGILSVLDARDGALIWSRNAATDTQTKVPEWGFSGSPLVVEDVVVVAVSGALQAYDLDGGQPRWSAKASGGSYSSPHLATLGGVPQILLLRSAGALSVSPAGGALLWEHAWPGDGIVQPALTPDGDLLLGSYSGMGEGARPGVSRLAVSRGPGGWSVVERWTSNALKPYFNDFVVHSGYAYGFDGGILACIGLQDGKRKWKGGRYGYGQILLLRDQDLLLALSEQGELALVRATPDQFTEVARFPALEGKTWNHPALAGDVLLTRNSEEMAAFRLALAGR